MHWHVGAVKVRVDKNTKSGWVSWAIAGVLLLVSAGVPPRLVKGQSFTLRDFEGRYSFAGGTREQRSLRAAIDQVVAQFNLFVREIARGELLNHVRVEDRLYIRVVGDRSVSVAFDDWGPHEVPLDGRAVAVRGSDGGRTQLSGRFERGRLLVRQRSSRGVRNNWFDLASDRERLTLRVQVSSEQLPDEIKYALTYERR